MLKSWRKIQIGTVFCEICWKITKVPNLKVKRCGLIAIENNYYKLRNLRAFDIAMSEKSAYRYMY